MGESDDKDILSGLGDLDWDSALDEWEKNTFVPEVARDAETNRVANPLGKEAPEGGEKPPTARPAAGHPPDPTGDPIRLKDLGTEGTGTLIAPVPRELSDPPPPMPAAPTGPPGAPSEPPPPPGSNPSGGRLGVSTASLPPSTTPRPGSVLPPPPAHRGGLGQLFSRSVRPPPVAPPPPRPPSEKTRVAPPVGDLASEKASSVTRQLAVPPSSLGPSSSDKTVVRPSDEPPEMTFDLEKTQERPASGNLVGPPSVNVGDAPTISTRDVAAAAMENALAELSRPASAPPAPPEKRVLQPIDDDDEKDVATVIADRKKLESISDADTATRHPAEDDEPTIGRPSAAPMAISTAVPSAAFEGFSPSIAPHTERERPPAPEGPVTFEGERPVSRWLDEKTTAAYRARAVWLEEEARTMEDPVAQARALLAVSEILALVGEDQPALNLALEARDLAPQLPLAWLQARQLMPRDPDALAEALDAEATRAPTASARAHATLLAADLLRLTDRGDAAVERWDGACKLDPADVRAPIARAALALAQQDHTSGVLVLAENSDLIAVDKAVATALRLRGVERAGAEVEELPINEGLRRARSALATSDAVTTAQALTEVAKVPELSKAALWLSASFGATHIAARRGAAKSLKTLAAEGESLAKRQLAARGIELGDPDLVNAALDGDGPFEVAERATLTALAAQDPARALDALADRSELASLHDALAAVSITSNADDVLVRSRRVSGTPTARGLATIGRLLAAKVDTKEIDEALKALPAPTDEERRAPSATGVAIEAAVRGRRFGELSEALAGLETGEDADAATQKNVAAAIVAERAGNASLARSAWKEAVAAGATHDGVLRIAAKLDPEVDLVAELLRAADDMPDGIPSALLRLEALARSTLSDDDQASVLEKVHRGAPALGIGSFLAERIARRKGDLDEVLRWIQERRTQTNDPVETALDSVREALLVADRDPELASTRLEEAHRARPDDVALRELFERLASEPPADRGAWREKRAESLTGGAKAAMLVEAAIEHERAGDQVGALRAARAAVEAGDRGIAPLALDRAELAAGEITRQADQLLAKVKTTDDPIARREAHERLADLEAYGKKDRAAALTWHRTILDDVEGDPKPHKSSLRFVEHELIGEGRDDELEPLFEQIALALDGTAGGEVTGHAQHAARFLMRTGAGWEKTRNMAVLAATQPEPSLWALRALNAHARVMKDEEAILKTTIALLERTQRPSERAALLLRASESAARLEQVADARAYLEQAASEDPGDVVTWGFLAEVRERAGEARAAAEACESLARTSAVREHQLLAFHDAAKIWLDEVKDGEKAMAALEAAAEIDPNYADVFKRLSALYAEKRLDAELARLLERRLDTIEDPEERVALEVDLARAQAEMGDLAKAKTALESALKNRPDHTTALGAMADICAKEGDWTGAENAYVRLARLLTTPDEQKEVYEKLAEIYAVHLQNLSRAEVAYKEVLKRGTNDQQTILKLVDVYKRQGDIARAVEMQQQLISAATDPNERLERLIELAAIHETVGRDPRRSEQVLDSARKEYPTSVVALRAMAEFYSRQRQAPAMQILLDRAAGDARRAFAQGRFVPSLFEVLHAAFELRGKKDAARVVAATLAAVEGQSSDLNGAEARAIDPRLDDVLSPEIMSPALRTLLFRAGDALDAVSPVDLRALRAEPLRPGTQIGATVGSIATVIGLGAMQILVSPNLGRIAVPLHSTPTTILVGEGLMKVPNERARVFVVVRALKAILTRSSALFRAQPADAAVLGNALFAAFNPSFVPQNVDARRVSDLARRIVPALPRNLDPTVGVIALEAAGMLGGQGAQLAPAAVGWANRAALLSVGDPAAALDAIAWAMNEEAAPKGSEERAAWIARHQEARDLMTYSVTDQYAEARTRLGLDK